LKSGANNNTIFIFEVKTTTSLKPPDFTIATIATKTLKLIPESKSGAS
jgi:hypothetical protein